MKFKLMATVYVVNEIEAADEAQAKDIFRQQLGLFVTNPFSIEVVEEMKPMEEESSQEQES